MNTYAIRRENTWSSAEEPQAVAKRATAVAASEFPDEVQWIRSYVIAEDSGSQRQPAGPAAADRGVA